MGAPAEGSEFSEVFDAFLSMEEELGLFHERVDGVPYWERVRHPLFLEVIRERGIVGEAHSGGPGGSSGLRHALGYLARGIRRNPLRADPASLLVNGSPRRVRRSDGAWWDIYTDPILAEGTLEYVQVETTHQQGHRHPVPTPELRYLDLLEARAAFRRRMGLVPASIVGTAREHLEHVRDEVRRRFNVNLPLEDIVRHDLHVRASLLPEYERLLDHVDPELVLLVTSSSKETFIEACKRRGVPVAELQHGWIGRHHLGYHFPGNRPKTTFPDHLLTFGPHWTRDVELPIPPDRVHPVGFPYLEDEVERLREVPRRDRLLFVSQGIVGEEMSRLATDLVREHPDLPVEVVYKLHPGEFGTWRDRYPWLQEEDGRGLRVVADEVLFHELLASSRVQVGFISTGLFEGLAFGLRTLVLDHPGVEQVAGLVEEGHATLVGSPAEVAAAVGGGAAAGGPEVNALFRPSARANAQRVLRELLASGG